MPLFTVDPDKCNRDGICVSECPSRVILAESPKDVPIAAPDAEEHCIQCGHCVSVCPEGAISLSWLKPGECSSLDPELRLTPDQSEQFLASRRSIRSFRKKPLTNFVIAQKMLPLNSRRDIVILYPKNKNINR